MKKSRWTICLLLTLMGWGVSAPQESIRDCEQWLAEFTRSREKVAKLHPALQVSFPVVIAHGDSVSLYRYDERSQRYQFQVSSTAPFPLPQGIRAAMPVEIANWEMACIVSTDILQSHQDDVLLLHEFVHCWQWQKGEGELKDSLDVYQSAMREQRYDWELSYPFPYHLQEVEEAYRAWVESLKAGTINPTLRKQLRSLLSEKDNQYLLWVEWKEGLARTIENQIRHELNLPENFAGSGRELNRVSFYWGGEQWIKVLQRRHPEVLKQPVKLFRLMQNLSVAGIDK